MLGELVFGRADDPISINLMDFQKEPYQTRPNAPIPTGCKSVYLIDSQLENPSNDVHVVVVVVVSYLLVISKVVPKI